MATESDTSASDKSPIGPNEIVAIGLGAVALWRIRQRRRKASQARKEAQQAQGGAKDAGTQGEGTAS